MYIREEMVGCCSIWAVESVPTDSLVDLHVFQQVGLLAEGLGAGVAFEGFFARVRPQVDFDVGFVEESAVADVTPVDGLLLAVADERPPWPSP